MSSEQQLEVTFFGQQRNGGGGNYNNNIYEEDDDCKDPESWDKSKKHNRLSYISSQYDVEGKGSSTKDQQMLRNLDTDGDRKLDAAELRRSMQCHNELRSNHIKLRRKQLILGLTTFLFGILTIVSKTIVDPNSLLALVTQSNGISIDPEMKFHKEGGLRGEYVRRSRRLEELMERLALITGERNRDDTTMFHRTIYDAVIIGAGWAGIAAAATLLENGVENILILEGRDYVGGRCRTVFDFATEGPETPFEMGAEFIYTEWKNEIHDIFQKHEIDYTTADLSSSLFAPQVMGIPDESQSSSSLLDHFEYEELTSRVWDDGFLKFVSKNVKYNDSGYESLLEDFEASEGIEDPFEEQFLEEAVNSDIVIEFAEDPEHISAQGTSGWLNEVSSAGMAVSSVPGGGYSRAIESFVEEHNLLDKITFGANVTRINYDVHEDLVQIDHLLDDGNRHSVFAQTVLVTAPLGVLKSGAIEFDPQIPSYKQEAIDAMEMGLVDKFIMYWDEATMEQAPNFRARWEDIVDNDWLELVTPETNTSKSFTCFSNGRKYNSLYTMTAWIGGSEAEKMEEMADEDIVEHVIANLKLMFAADVLPPTKYMVTRWGMDEYSRGSYTYNSVNLNFEGTAQVLSESIDSKVFFAGEHTSVSGWYGTAIGAFETGQQAANDMAESISEDFFVSLDYSH